MLRTILVALDESPWCEAATTLALEWGARFSARLVGLGIFDKAFIVDRFDPAPLGTSSFKQQADRARLAHAQEHLQRSLAKFSQRCSAAGIAAETLQDVGGPAECILRNAQGYDVVILGRETYFHFETQEHSDPTLAQVLRRSPRPIVAVPKDLPAGKDVMVAYGGGREVARTLQTFQLLGLTGDETIHVVSVCGADQETDKSAELAAAFLKSHDAAFQLHLIRSNLEPAQLLLDQVKSIQPRLLVMGAQGHHPVRDLFATSVTRAVLRGCPVPVLVGA